ncbi:hypothetical protein BJ170DRAFT_725898 [Xylariales sp. AK1849]|nr:hypothetical protein BJ170DRAFT_725898 [Xylariales sp. AK1849]
MKLSITLLTLLAGWALASPAMVGDLEARVDCSTCGCSSAESCTFDVSLPDVIDFSNYCQNTDSGGGSSVVNKWKAGLGLQRQLEWLLYGVLRWSLSSADQKWVPVVINHNYMLLWKLQRIMFRNFTVTTPVDRIQSLHSVPGGAIERESMAVVEVEDPRLTGFVHQRS